MYGGPFCIEKYILYKRKQKTPKCSTQKSGLCVFANKGKLQNKSRPRLSGKVAASAVGRGEYE